MNPNPDHKPAKRQPLLPPFAEPGITPSLLFKMPSTGDMVPYQQTPLTRESPWPPPLPQAGPVFNQRIEHRPDQPSQGQPQELAAQDRAQLQRLCRHLRETDRCPGECVLSRARQNRRLRRFPGIR